MPSSATGLCLPPRQVEQRQFPGGDAFLDLADVSKADRIGAGDDLEAQAERRDRDRRQDVARGRVHREAGIDVLDEPDLVARHAGEDERIGPDVLGPQRRLLQQRVAGPAVVDPLQLLQRLDPQRRHATQGDDVEHGEIDAIHHQHGKCCRPFALQQFEAHRRVGLDHVDRRRLDRDVVDIDARRDAQPAAPAVAHQLQVVRDRLGPGDEFVGHLEHVVARRRRQDVAPGPLEHPQAELLFEGRDVAAERRLADPERRRRPAEMTVLGQHDGVLQQL